MSILGNLIEGLLGNEAETNKEAKPCSNCAGDCSIYPDACGECQEYKNKLIDQIYFIDHLDEYYARYEIVGTGTATTAEVTVCPGCGATNQSGNFCEYCGTQLRQDSGKIKVSGASEIPDPIQEAQNIIFERQQIVQKYSGSEGTGILDTLMNLVTGDEKEDFGNRMSTDEIKSMASAYGVTVGTYLSGLDNGIYLTASAKTKQIQQQQLRAATGRDFENHRDAHRHDEHRRPEPPHHHDNNRRPEPPHFCDNQRHSEQPFHQNGPHGPQGFGHPHGPQGFGHPHCPQDFGHAQGPHGGPGGRGPIGTPSGKKGR